MQGNIRIRGFLDYLKEKKKLALIIGGILLGILLLILGGASKEEEVGSVEQDDITLRASELTAYETRIEKEIELLCESVSGVSDVSVMISFSRGYLSDYAADDSGDPLTVGSGSNETPVLGALIPPAVAGVGIVCRGGSNADIQRTLIELVSTALGIPSNRVYITGK